MTASTCVCRSPDMQPLLGGRPLLASTLPHALHSLPSFAQLAAQQPLAIFLDYDGTLSPIVPNPEDAVISVECRQMLRRLVEQYPVSIVSGRSCEKLRNFIGFEMDFAGSHGLNIRSPTRTRVHPIGEKVKVALQEAKASLDAALADVPGYLTEDNSFCITAHYRRVPEELHERVHTTVHEVLRGQGLLKHKSGKMVHELRPAVDWHKGKAVEWLLNERKEELSAPLRPLYIGDDVADEDAFAFVNSVGGVGIKVVEPELSSSTATEATYRVDNPEQVALFLEGLMQQ